MIRRLAVVFAALAVIQSANAQEPGLPVVPVAALEAAEAGVTATQLFGAEARLGGESARVTDLLLDTGGQIRFVVANRPGADPVRVPWEDATLHGRVDRIELPGVAGAGQSDAGLWPVTRLLQDNILLRGGDVYGRVQDMLFDESGQAVALIAQPGLEFGQGGGAAALPFFGLSATYDPNLDLWQAPYTTAEVKELAAERLGER